MAIYGVSDYLEQPQRRRWDITQGAVVDRTWEGPKTGLATFIASTLPAGYSRIEIEDDNDLVVLVATYASSTTDGIGGSEPGDGLVQRWWELDGNDLEKSLWDHPKVRAYTDDYDVIELAAMRAKYEEILAGTATSSWTDADVAIAMEKIAKGIEAYTVSQYVLRKTEIVRTGASLAASHGNVNKVFGYSALTSAEPSLASYNLVAAAGLSALYWLKRTPDVRPTQNGLYEIVTEYWGAEEWDSWIYDTAT